jgi:mannose-6-phosphate isomerase
MDFLTNKDNSYTVNKPWGTEIWIAKGAPEFPYVLKEIRISTGFKSSLHFHVKKQETNVVVSGLGKLEYSQKKVDVQKYSEGSWTDRDMDEVLDSIMFIDLKPESVFHMMPGMLHRVHSDESIFMTECSSLEIDDVIRVQDDSGRGDGRIIQEHKIKG